MSDPSVRLGRSDRDPRAVSLTRDTAPSACTPEPIVKDRMPHHRRVIMPTDILPRKSLIEQFQYRCFEHWRPRCRLIKRSCGESLPGCLVSSVACSRADFGGVCAQQTSLLKLYRDRVHSDKNSTPRPCNTSRLKTRKCRGLLSESVLLYYFRSTGCPLETSIEWHCKILYVTRVEAVCTQVKIRGLYDAHQTVIA